MDCMPTQKHGDLSRIQYWMTEGLSPCNTVAFLAWSTGWQRVRVHAKAKAWRPKLLTPSNGRLRPGRKHGGLSCMEYWVTESLSLCQGKSLVANVTYTQQRTTQARMQARRPFLRRVLEVRGLDRHAHSTTPRTLDRVGVSSCWVLRMLRMLQGGARVWCRRIVSAAARFCLAMAIPRGVKPF